MEPRARQGGPGDGPLVVQGDLTLLLEAEHPGHEAARDEVARFAELVKAPEYMHTYRVTPLSIWNAASSGLSATWMIEALDRHSRYPVPDAVRRTVQDLAGRFGRLRLVRPGARDLPRGAPLAGDPVAGGATPDAGPLEDLVLEADEPDLLRHVTALPEVRRHLA